MVKKYIWTIGCGAVLVLAGLCGLLYSQGESAQWEHVRRVNDGDTVTLADGRKVRYLGINTPEIDYQHHRAQPFGYVAKEFNLDLVGKQNIRLEFDRETHDRFGRLLAYVFLEDDTFVNQQLLTKGYGYFYPSPKPGKYDQLLLDAQHEAMAAQVGIWKQWHEPGTGAGYTGNQRSKRFHRVDCPNGKKISRKNRCHFKIMWDAFWAGYAPAKGCLDAQLGWPRP